MAESSTITREMIEAAARRIVQRIEDAIPEPIFTCEADREEAVEIAQEEAATVAAAYGSKRRPYYGAAVLGLDGMGANLRLSDGSLELVFKDEELDLINEEGRDLYISRLAGSEAIALRQWLIDYLPASEAEISAGRGVMPAVSVPVPASGTEERSFWLEAARHHGFREAAADWEEWVASDDAILKLMAAAREQGRKDVLDALATGGARG